MEINCPICKSPTSFLTQKKDRFGQEYDYFACENCRFLFEKGVVENRGLLIEKVSKVYGKDYFEKIDTGWQGRGDSALKVINAFIKIYGYFKNKVTVLDYGAGNGYVTAKIKTNGTVFYYDSYEKPTYLGNYTVLQEPQNADVIYAIELVEHLTDASEWDFLQTLSPNVFIFTTGLSDNIPETELAQWTYLDPDAGHTSLYSTKSLHILAKKYGFMYFFFPNISCHIFLRNRFLSGINFVVVEYFLYSIVRNITRFFR
ncbi:MAG: class I SAM-dependent methyltransferase [Candidatus Staskawiczbacteria bacterium]|nr:class I SAM-dependent methyltransferase [Candidatus Staskawiczbacteria bacterium]